jgi:hypothetical protein
MLCFIGMVHATAGLLLLNTFACNGGSSAYYYTSKVGYDNKTTTFKQFRQAG